MPKARAEILRDAWNASGAPLTQWVSEARADEVIVVDDSDPTARKFVRVPAVIASGGVTFGAPQPYDPDTDRVVVYASAAESRPPTPDPEPVEPAPKPESEPTGEPEST
ncbi:hypothetical protein C1I95_28190, partial [Micromonospora craterilacus]